MAIHWRGVIHGDVRSKANSRKIVRFGARLASIKSKPARDFAEAAAAQIPVLDDLVIGDVAVAGTIYYRNRRPDLDESLVLDALQGRIILNDRQVKAKLFFHGLDKNNPRVELVVMSLYHMTEFATAFMGSFAA